MAKLIYTIGHSTHPIEDFIDLLKSYERGRVLRFARFMSVLRIAELQDSAPFIQDKSNE